MEGIIFIGLQASGKSSFYKENFFNSHVRISLDLLNTRNKENQFIEKCFELHQKFVIDNTNPSIKEREKYIQKLKDNHYKIIGYFFQSKIKDALARNETRAGILNDLATFDCRISQLPTKNDVVDYFRWRNEDAFRNALNAHCYWKLRMNNKTVKQATKQLEGMSVADKNQLLFDYGVNFNDLPNWQKRGIGFYWKEFEKEGNNLQTGVKTVSIRKKIHIDYELPMKDNYSAFIEGILDKEEAF